MDHNTSDALRTLTMLFHDEAHRLRLLEQIGAFQGPSGPFVHWVHDQIYFERDVSVAVDSAGMARFVVDGEQELPTELVSFPLTADVSAGARWMDSVSDPDLIPDFDDVPYRAAGGEE
jgi:hypothetical protein